MLNYSLVTARAKHYEKPMASFLRDIIAIPSESGQERRVIARIQAELRRLRAYDRVWTDPMGNLLAQVGTGKKLIAIDAHVDTVGLGDPAEWRHDPYRGKVVNRVIYGRGAGDQKGAIPAMVYSGRIIKDLGLATGDFTLLLTFTIQEEDCDGLCWQYIVREGGLRPDCVVVTDSTNCRILRGQRGRMEIGITTTGRSCHGSMPHRGINAVYKLVRVISEIEKLNDRLKEDSFLGKGTVTVSYIDCQTPSLCAVPNGAFAHLDRRLTSGETKASAIREVKEAARRAGVQAKVEVLRYAVPSYTGLVYETEKYFPTWCAGEDDLQVRAAAGTYQGLFRQKPDIGRWTFSTNAVAIAGMFGIPCVGFGPAEESVAHTVNDRVPIDHLIKCAAFYAAYPTTYCLTKSRG